MLYRPKSPRILWDSWLFEWNEEIHLFYLEAFEDKENFYYLGHKISTDMAHWKECDSVQVTGFKGQWNEKTTLTGWTLEHDGKFYMFVGSTVDNIQVIGMFCSEDLHQWKTYPDFPLIKAAGPHYLETPNKNTLPHVDWRDPRVSHRDEEGFYHITVCARKPEINHEDFGACVAHLRSMDLIHWEILPPINAPLQRFYNAELPEIFKLNDNHYLLINSDSRGGLRNNTPSRDSSGGSYYFISDNYEGPYREPEDCTLLSSSMDVWPYAGRTTEHNGQRLLTHLIRSHNGSAFAPLKTIDCDNKGNLKLKYHPALEKLERSIILDNMDLVEDFKVTDYGLWKREKGKLSAINNVAGTYHKLSEDIADFHLCCKINSNSAARTGVILRGFNNKSIMVSLDFEYQKLEIAPAMHHEKTGWGAVISPPELHCIDFCRKQLKTNTDYHLRCFVRAEFFEVYLNDELVFSVAACATDLKGDLGLFVERGQASFSDLRLAEIESL